MSQESDLPSVIDSIVTALESLEGEERLRRQSAVLGLICWNSRERQWPYGEIMSSPMLRHLLKQEPLSHLELALRLASQPLPSSSHDIGYTF